MAEIYWQREFMIRFLFPESQVINRNSDAAGVHDEDTLLWEQFQAPGWGAFWVQHFVQSQESLEQPCTAVSIPMLESEVGRLRGGSRYWGPGALKLGGPSKENNRKMIQNYEYNMRSQGLGRGRVS